MIITPHINHSFKDTTNPDQGPSEVPLLPLGVVSALPDVGGSNASALVRPQAHTDDVLASVRFVDRLVRPAPLQGECRSDENKT